MPAPKRLHRTVTVESVPDEDSPSKTLKVCFELLSDLESVDSS